jgi:hypothetical protein
MDRDNNKIFDSLDLLLSNLVADDRVPVLIMANTYGDIPAIEKAAGEIVVKYRYKVVPAIAATLTKSQIQALAKEPGVSHIEHDAEVKTLQGSTDYFGATKARQDFGVTGNHDGQPAYSKSDIVIPTLDLQHPDRANPGEMIAGIPVSHQAVSQSLALASRFSTSSARRSSTIFWTRRRVDAASGTLSGTGKLSV